MDQLIAQSISNPVFNDQFAGQLGTAHPYIAVFLVLLQLVIIPVCMFIGKRMMAENKEKIEALKSLNDKETELRKKERDAQIEEIKRQNELEHRDIDSRLTIYEKDSKNMIQNLLDSQNRLNSTLDRLFNRFDTLTEKVNELSIFVHTNSKKD